MVQLAGRTETQGPLAEELEVQVFMKDGKTIYLTPVSHP